MINNSLNLSKVKKNIYTVLREQLIDIVPSGQIVWRENSEPLPARPCVTLKLINTLRRHGTSDNVIVDQTSNTNDLVGGFRTSVLNVQVFGNSNMDEIKADQIAAYINLCFSKTSVFDKLSYGIDGSNGVSIMSVGDVDDISALEETEYEDRFSFDVVLGMSDSIIDDLGRIENVNFIEDIDN